MCIIELPQVSMFSTAPVCVVADEHSWRSSSRSVSVTHGFSFPSLSAAISRSNGILGDLGYDSSKLEAELSSKAAVKVRLGLENTAGPLDDVKPAIKAEIDSSVSGPFDLVSATGYHSKRVPEDGSNPTSPSRSSDGQSCASMASPICEKAAVRAKAALQRHSMASSWIAEIQLLPNPEQFRGKQEKLETFQLAECAHPQFMIKYWETRVTLK